jgi:elongation factor Ts
MSQVTASLVKELRDRTGLGMMECKRALTEAGAAIDKAIEELRKSSGMKAAKKAGRTAADGKISIKVEGDTGVLVEVNCETDFAAKDSNFLEFVSAVTDAAFSSKSADVQTLLDNGFEKTREELVQKIGENVSIRRIEVVEGAVTPYLHTTGKIGVLVVLEGGNEELGKDVAMHIAAADPQPQYVNTADVPEAVIAAEKDIYVAQAAESGKPPEIIEKMVGGRVKKFLSEISLVEQPFVKDPDTRIGGLLKKEGASVVKFVRFQVGEGIEVEEVDFAAEVASQLGQ